MSGHSKWSTIKHQKGAADKSRALLFTKLGKAISQACQEGGDNPESNVRLRFALDKAKMANMPKDTILRSIERGKGGQKGENLTDAVYEGFGPHQVAVLVHALTDNKQRTASEIKNIFSRSQGVLSGVGSVAYLFQKIGLITLTKDREISEIIDKIIATNALDFEEVDDQVLVITFPEKFHEVEIALKNAGLKIQSGELGFRPQTTVKLDGQDAQGVINLLETLEDLPDVQQVYTNLELVKA